MSGFQLSSTLKGHEASILSCKCQVGSTLVATGAEDGSLCVFDLASGLLVTKCDGFPNPDVTSVDFHPSDSNRLFAACGEEVIEFDVRTIRSSFNESIVNRFGLSSEEINRISIHPNGHLLAAADDSGDVMIMDLNHNTPFQRLTGIHTNICSSTTFSPYAESELISGGLDARLVGWNFEDAQLLWKCTMGGESEAQVYNPPMVHDVAVPIVGEMEQKWPGLVAAARGDGVVWVGFGQGLPSDSESDAGAQLPVPTTEDDEQDANTSSEDYVLLDYSKGGHTASVSCIKFLPHSFGQKLVSGGGDCMLIGWDWLEACEGSHDPLPKLWSVNHHQKINCVDLRSTELIVADVEPDLTVYIAA